MLKRGLLALVLARIVKGSLFNHAEALGMGCALAAQDLFTTCDPEDFACFCASGLFVYSVEECISREANHNSTMMGEAFDKFETRFCEAHNSNANLTDAWSYENEKVNPVVTKKAFILAYDGERNNMSEKEVSLWLGLGLIFYWVAIAAGAVFFKVFRRILIRLFPNRMIMRRVSPIERWLQRHLFWPALFNSRHMSPYQFFRGWAAFSLPTRFESVVVGVYVLLNFIFMLTPYTFMNNDPLFQTRWKEMMRYASDRSGIIATVQFPLLTLFALRNNVLQWLCGWSYSTFNAYHRAVARVTYILLIVHAVMKHIFSASYGASLTKFYYPVPYFRWGVAAMGLFSLMIMFAIIRGRRYELFYRLHQSMAIGGLICSIFHLNGLGFKTPLWISIALWGADWTIRVGRILLFNVNFIFAPLAGAHHTSYATARVYDGQYVKLTVTTPVKWIAKPGQYIFLHTNRWTFIGGHPFSVVGSDASGDGLEVLVKARTGLTRKLHSALDDQNCSPDYPVTIPVYVEGPYGNSAPVENYQEGLFFAGGIGITGVIGYIEQMAKANTSNNFPKIIRLFWAIRSQSDIGPMASRLAQLSQIEGVFIRIFQRNVGVQPLSLANGIMVDQDAEVATIQSEEKSENRQTNFVKIKINDEVVSHDDEGKDTMPSSPDGAYSSKTATPTSEHFQLERTHKRKHSSIGSMFEGHQRKLSAITGHLRNPSRLRDSFIEFVNARNPEDDDMFDYGRASCEWNQKEGSDSSETECIIQREDGFNANAHGTQKSKYHKSHNRGNSSMSHSARCRNSEFVNAGFTDAFTESHIPGQDPFDDSFASHTGYGSKLARPMSGNANSEEKALIIGAIEPAGMNITSLIKHHFKHSEGSVCVVGCGPDRMMDTLCWSCCEFQEQTLGRRVDYFEEAFKW